MKKITTVPVGHHGPVHLEVFESTSKASRCTGLDTDIIIQEVATMSDAMNMKKSLKDRAKEFHTRLPFMDGRDKADSKELIGTINTIVDYGFLPNDTGELYAVFIVKERAGKFYFGGTVITDQLTQLDAEGYRDAIQEEGLPMLMTEKKSKSGRTYVNVEFFPED